ncbi:LamG domain-containing protein [Nocardia sp. NPDC055165]
MSRLVVRSMASALVLPGNGTTGNITPSNTTPLTVGLTNSISVGAWVKLKQKSITGNADAHTILRSGFNFASNLGYMFQIRPSDGSMALLCGNATGLSGVRSIPYGEWVHVAWVLSGTSLKGYVNGTEIWSISVTRKANDVGGNLFLQEGGGTGAAERRFCGSIAELFCVQSALTPTNLVDIMNGRFSLVTLDILYKLNDASGSTAVDSSGNSNNGTITSASWSTTDTPFKLRAAA